MFKIACKYLGYRYRQHRRKTSEKIVVDTIYGPVRGVKRISCWNDAYYSFERIPFAKPPVGELRFSEPQPPESWTEVIDGTYEASAPIQTEFYFHRVVGSEDCLYASVFTKEINPDRPRPVMVWIHGGGFVTGSTTKDLAGPDYFMSKDVVFVSLAYRLGIFGFLSLEDQSLKVPGNAGLKDQVMGLKWIQKNISKFGGDPNNVTIFGVSAGGASVHLLALSKQTEGLFHKAISMSGTALSPWVLPPKKNWHFRIAKHLGYRGQEDNESDILKFLRGMTPKKLSAAETQVITIEEKHDGFLWCSYPVIEPYATEQCLIPEHPVIMARTSWSNSIPMMFGGTSREGIFMCMMLPPGILDAWQKNPTYILPFDLKTNPESKECEELRNRLQLASFKDGHVSMDSYIDFVTYQMFWHGIHRIIGSRLKYAQAATYQYMFAFDSPEYSLVKCLGSLNYPGSSHGDDIGYIFVNMMTPVPNPGSLEEKIIKKFVGMLTQFAKTGDPNCEEIKPIEWKPEQSGGPEMCLQIAEPLAFIENPFNSTLSFWDELYDKEKLF